MQIYHLTRSHKFITISQFRYFLTDSFEKQKIRNALNDIMDAAKCLSFQEKSRSTAPNDYVEVIKSGG